MSQEVIAPRASLAAYGEIVLPRVIVAAGDHAARRFIEFFTATIRNRNTRAVTQLFDWCDQHQIGGLVDIEPVHVAAYIEGLQQSMSKPTTKQHLAALRILFDWLVIGQVVAMNPAHSVRGPKHVVRRGIAAPCLYLAATDTICFSHRFQPRWASIAFDHSPLSAGG